MTSSPFPAEATVQSTLFERRSPPSPRHARERIALHVFALTLPILRLPEDIYQAFIIASVTGLYVLSLWILAEGLRAEDYWSSRPVARAPRLPLKAISAAIMGLAIAAAFASDGTDLTASLLCGVAASGLHLAAFGLDPRTDRNSDTLSAFQAERVEDLTHPAHAHLACIAAALAPCDDPDITAATETLVRESLALTTHLGDDPAFLPNTRRALSVWLPALADATQRFARLHEVQPDPARSAELAATLASVASRIAALSADAKTRADARLSRDLATLTDAAR